MRQQIIYLLPAQGCGSEGGGMEKAFVYFFMEKKNKQTCCS